MWGFYYSKNLDSLLVSPKLLTKLNKARFDNAEKHCDCKCTENSIYLIRDSGFEIKGVYWVAFNFDNVGKDYVFKIPQTAIKVAEFWEDGYVDYQNKVHSVATNDVLSAIPLKSYKQWCEALHIEQGE